MSRVVKVGGSALEDRDWLARLGEEAARSPGPLVLVHGGGPEVSALSGRLGIAVEWVGGRRVTSPEALDVAGMVLSGRINKRVTGTLLSAGVDAVGFSGEDGGLIVAEPRDGGALGRVGRVVGVRAELLAWLMSRGLTPVVSPISRGTDGGPLNVNADEVATAVAVALGASELLFLTDVPGVHDGVATRGSLAAAEAAELLRSGVARDGMAVKVSSALAALEAGVTCVRIGPLAMLADLSAGTALRGEVGVAA